jgi:N-acetyl-alpha-D-muramate 1-phosphate uridylyltransferase
VTSGTTLCGVILAAGAGTRLRPLTAVRPKALCPVGNVALLDRALAHLAGIGLAGPDRVAVNTCHLGGQIVSHVDGRATVSVEPPPALGTAGGVANLRGFTAGRDVLVLNADAYLAPAGPGPVLGELIEGWPAGHDEVRLLGVPTGPEDPYRFGRLRFAGASLLPAATVHALPTGPAELVQAVWRPAERAGRLRLVELRGRYLDTGTPADYLAANLHAAAVGNPTGNLVAPDARVHAPLHAAVIGARAEVAGPVTRGVVWPDGRVGPDERLIDAIRVGSAMTLAAPGARATARYGRYGQPSDRTRSSP